jgi:hypothetical protein
MMPDEDRLRLRHTFNEAAGSYHRVRPTRLRSSTSSSPSLGWLRAIICWM